MKFSYLRPANSSKNMANRTWILLAECYANACIAQQLTQRLHGKVRHTPLYGRDKIVKKAVRMAQILNARVILVIDYERGNGYIDINFHLNQIGEGIHVDA